MKQSKGMNSTHLCSFLLTVMTGIVLPGHIMGAIPVTAKNYELAVLPPFVDALNSLTSVAETLLTSTNLPQGIQNVRQLLESSHKSLSKAEQSSLAQVKALSANVEQCLNKIKHLNDEQKVLEAQRQDLNVQLSGLQKQEYFTRQQLQAAEQAVSTANDALKKAIEAENAGKKVHKGVFHVMKMSVFGELAGIYYMMKKGEAIANAETAAKEAEAIHLKHKDTVKKYESQHQSCMEAIRSTEQTIAANTVEIQLLQRDLNSERALHQELNTFLISLRKCTRLLSTVSGKTSAANMYLELSGVLDGLLRVLDEIVVTLRPLVESSTDYSLLISVRLPTIIHRLEEANRRLKNTAAS